MSYSCRELSVILTKLESNASNRNIKEKAIYLAKTIHDAYERNSDNKVLDDILLKTFTVRNLDLKVKTKQELSFQGCTKYGKLPNMKQSIEYKTYCTSNSKTLSLSLIMTN